MSLTRAEVQHRYYSKNKQRLNKLTVERDKKLRTENPVLARENDRRKRELKKQRGYKQPPYKRVKTEREYARIKLNNAVKLGKVIRPSTCSRCQEKAKVQGHHPDYSKPLEVIWLCSKCHGLEHHPIQALSDVTKLITEVYGE